MFFLWSPARLAQGNCGNIVFGEAITSQFPNARNACLGVVTREGREFAHFQARIRNVRAGQVEAEFKLPDGTWGRPAAFTPASDGRVITFVALADPAPQVAALPSTGSQLRLLALVGTLLAALVVAPLRRKLESQAGVIESRQR